MPRSTVEYSESKTKLAYNETMLKCLELYFIELFFQIVVLENKKPRL